MSKELSIRSYDPRDASGVEDLFRASMAEFDEGRESELRAYVERALGEELRRIPEYYLRDPGTGFWVVEKDGAILGMVGVERVDRETAEVRRMVVAADHRRCGIGMRLLHHAERHSVERAYRRIVLNTATFQHAATEVDELESSHKTIGSGTRRVKFVKELGTA